MMKKTRKLLAILALAAMSLMLLVGCGEKKTALHVTVVNRTTYTIADIRFSPSTAEDWGPNRLETTLEEGEMAEIDLGEYTQEELDSGFNVQFYGEDGEPINPDYDPSAVNYFGDGDYFIFAPPEGSVAFYMDTGYDAAEYDAKLGALSPDDGRGGDGETAENISDYAGVWVCEPQYDYDYIEIDTDGNWRLHQNGEIVATGWLQYESEWNSMYAYDDADGSACVISLQDGRLYIGSYGYFAPGDGVEDNGYDDGGNGGLTEDDEHSAAYDIAGLKGIWYYDGDLSAETYIVFDTEGNWSLYQRAPGAESEEMDYGTIVPVEDNTLEAYSDVYDGLTYSVVAYETGTLIWGDEGAFEWMEY